MSQKNTIEVDPKLVTVDPGEVTPAPAGDGTITVDPSLVTVDASEVSALPPAPQQMPAIPGMEKLGALPGVPVRTPKLDLTQRDVLGLPTPSQFAERLASMVEKGAQNAVDVLLENAKLGIVPGGALPPPMPTGDPKQVQKQAEKAAESYDKPLLPLSELTPDPGLLRGTARFGEGLTSTMNLGILGATSAMGGMVAGAASPYVKALYHLVDTGLSAYFASQMGAGALEGARRAYDAYQRGDMDAVAEELGYGTLEGLMGAFAAKHFGSKAKAIAKESAEGYRLGMKQRELQEQLDAKERARREQEAQAKRDQTPKLTPSTDLIEVNPADVVPSPQPGSPAPETPATTAIVRYQHPRGEGEPFGKRTEIRSLDEEGFNNFVKPRLKPGYAPTLPAFQKKNPGATHYAVTQTANDSGFDEWKFAGTGTPEDLRPSSDARQFDDFESEEAKAQGRGGKVQPIKKSPAKIDLVPTTDSPVPKPEVKPVENTEEDQFSGHVLGDRTEVKTARGNVYDAQWAWVPVDQVTLSHDLDMNENPRFPAEAQPRDRTRAASRVQRDETAAKYDFREASDSFLASHGAPLSLPSTVRISGNLRGNALQHAYEQRMTSADDYRRRAIENAGRYGLDPEAMKKIPNGELLRIIRSKVDDLHGFAVEANEDSVAKMSATEQAAADAKLLTGDLMKQFRADDEGGIVHAGNRDFVRAFVDKVVSQADRGSYMLPDGSISQAGIARIRNAVFAKAYGDQGAIEKLAESPDSNIRNITAGMLHAAPQFAAMNESIGRGDMHPLSITEEVNAAAAKLAALREDGTTVDQYLNQGKLFGSDIPEDARAILGIFDAYKRTPKKIATFLRHYAAAVEAAGNPKQASMFTRTPPTKNEMIEAAAKLASEEFGDERSATDNIPSLFTQEPAADGGADRESGEEAASSPSSGSSGSPSSGSPSEAEVSKPAESSAHPVTPSLLEHLRGAKPRYNFGTAAFVLDFKSDLDKAAYIAAQKERSKADQEYVDFARKHTGLSEGAVRLHGAKVRQTIKELAKQAEGGTQKEPALLTVPAHDWAKPKAPAPASPAAESTPPLAGPVAIRKPGAIAPGEAKPKGAAQPLSPAISPRLPEPGLTPELPGALKPAENNQTTESPSLFDAPDPHLIPGTEKLIERIFNAIQTGEDIRLKLPKIAEPILGKRSAGGYEQQDLYEIQEAAMNRWLAENGKRLLGLPFDQAAGELRGVVAKLATQTIRSGEKISKQQFSTPPAIAYLVDRVAAPRATDQVLEPSAGVAGLVAMLQGSVAGFHLNEIDPRRLALARTVGLAATESAVDGELIHALADPDVRPTLVIMNPPFSAGALKSNEARNNNKYGFNHVQQSLQRLGEGGRAVILLGEGADLTAAKGTDFWQGIAKRYNIRANVGLPGDEYRKYGTTFGTRMIVIDKTGPTPGATWLEQLAQPVRGDYDSIESAWKAVEHVATDRPVPVDRTPARADAPGGNGARGNAEPVGTVRVDGSGGLRGVPKPARSGQGAAGVSGVEPGSGSVGNGVAAQDLRPDGTEKSGRGDSEDASGTSEPRRIKLTPRKAVAQPEDSGAFVLYEPSIEGAPHRGTIVETKSMATVPLPRMTYQPTLAPRVVDEGLLSAVQLEAVAIVGQQNNVILPSGERSTALVGDGTGVGKGRIGAGILLDNFNQGRRRLLWVSEKWDLASDALRDLRGLAANELIRVSTRRNKKGERLKRGDDFDYGKPIKHEGVLFATYSMLRSSNKQNQRRIDQIKKWLEGDGSKGLAGVDGGFALFDEAHNLKNTTTSGAQQASQQGERVADLLRELPKLRTGWLTATAASEVQNMGYLGRLGLWGPKTAFPNGFPQFAAHIGASGISAMELVAREMKAQGKYLSRSLSFKGIHFDEVPHKINPDQEAIYESAAQAWAMVAGRLEGTLQTVNGGAQARAGFMNQFYASAQRFFNLLITALKVPTALEGAQKALDEGKSAVITLVNTNEAAQKREENKQGTEDEEEDGLDFGPAEILVNLVEQTWPVQQWADDIDQNGNPIKVAVFRIDDKGNRIPVLNEDAVKERDDLVKKLKAELRLPENPLDIIINAFGTANVAELTGRQKRYDSSTGKFVNRAGSGVPVKSTNLTEMAKFQGGEKRVAILSNAAGTGISLHSDLGAKNQSQRVHITLQFGWSADKQIQMFGRTHRTNQAVVPHYLMIVSDLAGEKRFVSTIAKRMKSLGALTRGSKDASGGTDEMANLDLDSAQGRQAAVAFYNRMLRDAAIPGLDGATGLEILTQMGVLKQTSHGPEIAGGADNVNRLLNRILMLAPKTQRAVFGYYYDIFDAAVRAAIENGTLDTGVKELHGHTIEVKERRAIAADPDSGAQTDYYPVDVTTKRELFTPQNLDDAMDRNPDQWEMYRIEDRNDQEDGRLLLTLPARDIVHADGRIEPAVYVYRPDSRRPVKMPASRFRRDARQYTGIPSLRHQLETDLASKRSAFSDAERDETAYRRTIADYERRKMPAPAWAAKQLASAEARIETLWNEIPALQKQVENYRDYAREAWREAYEKEPETVTETTHLIGGAVLKYWSFLQPFMRGIYLAQDSNTRERVVGMQIEGNRIREVVNHIAGGGSTVTPHQLYQDVLGNGTEYQLQGGIRVRRGRVQRDSVIQFQTTDRATQTALKEMGVRFEGGVVPMYYLPTGDYEHNGQTVSPYDVLTRVMERYPVVEDRRVHETGEAGSVPLDFLTLGLASKLQNHGPLDQVSALGALADRLVRNLSQLEKVSAKSHSAAVRTASSQSQTTVLLRAAVPRIVKALERNGGPSWYDMRRTLIESRLRGIRERWNLLGDQVGAWTNEEVEKSFTGGHLAPILDAVAGVESQVLGLDPKQTVAGYIDSQQFGAARKYLSRMFATAAKRVARMMEPAEFDQLANDPGLRAALKVYKQLIEKPLADNHELNEGVFSDALGPLDTYYPLIPVKELDPLGAALSAAAPYNRPRNISNDFATGLAPEYDPSMAALSARIEKAIKANNKAGLISVLADEGLLKLLSPGELARDTMLVGGKLYQAATIEVADGRTVRRGNQTMYFTAQQAVVPKWLKRELAPILERRDIRMSRTRQLVSAINAYSLAGPLDFVFHATNLIGALVANTPFLGSKLANGAKGAQLTVDVIKNLPFTKLAAAIIEIASTDPATVEAAKDLAAMAKLGLVPDKYASETYSKEVAEQTGARVAKISLGPLLYGEKGIDIRARLAMYRLAKRINPQATDRELYKFVNQLGNYVRSLQGDVERALKDSGIAPFYTAGSTMYRNGIHAVLGTGPIPGGGGGGNGGGGNGGGGNGGGSGAMRQRMLQQLTGGLIGAAALWIAAYRAYTGKWPWEDRKAKLLQLPVKPEHRATPLGRALWGTKPGTAYLNLQFFNPLMGRGLRAVGAQDAFETGVLGGGGGQVLESAIRGQINSSLHPITTGPLVKAGTIALTGNEPYVTGVHPFSMFPATAKTKPGLPMIAERAKESVLSLNGFTVNIAGAAGFGHKADENQRKGNAALRMATDLVVPRLIGGVTNQEAKAARLRRERYRGR